MRTNQPPAAPQRFPLASLFLASLRDDDYATRAHVTAVVSYVAGGFCDAARYGAEQSLLVTYPGLAG